MSESYYNILGFDLKAEKTIYTIKITEENKNNALEERLQKMSDAYPDYAFESRVQELADEMQIQQRKREFARYFAVGLTPK